MDTGANRSAMPGGFSAAQAGLLQLTVTVTQVGRGDPITDFKSIVNDNNVGDPFEPDPANWPSLKPGASHSPVVATGDATRPWFGWISGTVFRDENGDGEPRG